MTKDQERTELARAHLTLAEMVALGHWQEDGWSMADVAEHMGEGKQSVARKIWSAKKKLADVGLSLPARDAPHGRRATPMDTGKLDTHPSILAVV